jgi:hypothetical protein
MATYRVTVALKFPSVYDRGTELVIEDVKNKKEAISEARASVKRQMLYDRHDGALEYSAVQIEEQVPVFSAQEMLRVVEAAASADQGLLDPRVGILMREGTRVYYAFVNGKCIENTDLAIVMAAL